MGKNKSFRLLRRSLGPGVVFILSVLGAGDIIDISVAGSHFGYSLMWALLLSAVLRFTLLSTYAKYQLLNPRGETITDGYRRLGRIVQAYIVVVLSADLVMWSASNCIGSGVVLNLLFPGTSPPVWGTLVAASGFMLILTGGYNAVSKAFTPILMLMVGAFIACLVLVQPDWHAILKGAFRLAIPPGKGLFGGSAIAVSVVGTLGGTPSSLFYASFLKEKGWAERRHRGIQTIDLAMATTIMVVINLAIWSTAAEVLHPAGVRVREARDMGRMLGMVIGPGGAIIFYLGLLAALFANLVGNSMGLSMAVAEMLHTGFDPQAKKGRRMVFRICLFAALAFGILASWSRLGFIPLMVVGMALQVPMMSVLTLGILIISNREEWIGKGNTNRWYENLILITSLVINLCLSAALISDFIGFPRGYSLRGW